MISSKAKVRNEGEEHCDNVGEGQVRMIFCDDVVQPCVPVMIMNHNWRRMSCGRGMLDVVQKSWSCS